MAKHDVIIAVEKAMVRADKFFNRRFIRPKILFNIKETSGGAGRCEYIGILRFNPFYVREYPQEMIEDTVPHEVAHLIAWRVYEHKGHGRPWRDIMWDVFDVKPQRCHDYTTQNMSKKPVDLTDLLPPPLDMDRVDRVFKKLKEETK